MVAALRRAGFILVYIEGSHHFLEPSEGGALVTVPVHTNKILKPKTLKSILEQAGLNIQELKELL
ncbi:MAG: type II toxin-antitoxin system HicA family toxin [Desulfosporosinus sp.]